MCHGKVKDKEDIQKRTFRLAAEKWEMYNTGKNYWKQAGFVSIGMDHFALPDDKLFAAAAKR